MEVTWPRTVLNVLKEMVQDGVTGTASGLMEHALVLVLGLALVLVLVLEVYIQTET